MANETKTASGVTKFLIAAIFCFLALAVLSSLSVDLRRKTSIATQIFSSNETSLAKWTRRSRPLLNSSETLQPTRPGENASWPLGRVEEERKGGVENGRRGKGGGALFVVVASGKDERHYPGLPTLHCYALQHGLAFHRVQPAKDPRSPAWCRSLKSLLYSKHCTAAAYLSDYEWMAVFDADSAVLNTNKSLADFLPLGADVVFYRRLRTGEVMAGNYLVRNTQRAIDFLEAWSRLGPEANERLPRHFFNYDNGVLHIAILRTLFPQLKDKEQRLWDIFPEHDGYTDWVRIMTAYGKFLLAVMEPFSQKNLKPSQETRIAILERGCAWSRDIDMSMDRYPGDFIAHGVKSPPPFSKSFLEELKAGLKGEVGRSKCSRGDWAPVFSMASQVSEERMRARLKSEAETWYAHLKPRDTFPHKCWPRCTPFFFNSP